MKSRFLSVSLIGSGLVSILRPVAAVSVPFSAISSSTSRLSFGTSKDQASDDTFTFENENDVIYTADLKVAGQTFVVQLDTGSSDLWLDTTGLDLSSFEDTGVESTITYGDGTVASGKVLIGDVTLGDFTTKQAFISAPGTNATTLNDKGLLGLGPPLLSRIFSDIHQQASSLNGQPFLSNIFDSSSTEPFITFALSRSDDTAATGGGVFTIGEFASNSSLSGIQNSNKIDVIADTERWIVLMDGMVVNGQKVTGNSVFAVPGQSSTQTLANIDSGTSLAQIPSAYGDAIYGNVVGAQLSNDGTVIVPCDTNLNVSFIFGGVEYPIHPIDTVQATTDTNGNIICFGGFIISDPEQGDTQDLLLGDTFLRNVYTAFNFGEFVSGSDVPTLQLLSITDADTAASQFEELSKARNSTLLGEGSDANSAGGSGGGGSSGGGSSNSARSRESRLGVTLLLPLVGFLISAYL